MEIKNVVFRYGKGATVLEQLNLQLKPGSIYGLLGENGVGKTTLLKMMAGLLFPNEGEIRV
ncbi:MAG: ATP-binding cassette domain-containing protein, partial [Bacteroidales bacterium]|nr:ATP-binding cassette domain-containing protein [Bacteroidales bacterium]